MHPTDETMGNSDLIARHQEIQRDAAQVGFAFLNADIETALTFVDRAMQAQVESETRHRNQHNARHAYDTVTHIISNLDTKYLEQDELITLEHKLNLLKSQLLQLGEKFE